jgi:hypothetical protein
MDWRMGAGAEGIYMGNESQTESTGNYFTQLASAPLIIAMTGALFYLFGYTYHDEWLAKLGIATRSVDLSMQIVTLYGWVPVLGLLLSFTVCMGFVASIQILMSGLGINSLLLPQKLIESQNNKTGKILGALFCSLLVLMLVILGLGYMATSAGRERAEKMLRGVCPFIEFADQVEGIKHTACYVADGKDGSWFIELKSNSGCSFKSLYIRRSDLAKMSGIVKPAVCGGEASQ